MKKKNFTGNIYLTYFIALIPLILFGLYKNGIELYQKGLVDVLNMLKPLILLSMGISGALIGSFIREYKSTKSKRKALKNSQADVLYAILVVAILPIKSSPLIIFLVTFISSLFLHKVKINKVALMFVIIESINTIFRLNTFYNAYQVSTELNYDGLDLFWGLGSGGTFSTSILFTLLGLILLSSNKLYKKEITYSAILTIAVLGLVPNMITGNYGHILPFLFGYNIMFTAVFIAPDLHSSTYTVKGQITSGILISILTYLISFIWPFFAAPIAVLTVSMIKNILDRLFVIK